MNDSTLVDTEFNLHADADETKENAGIAQMQRETLIKLSANKDQNRPSAERTVLIDWARVYSEFNAEHFRALVVDALQSRWRDLFAVRGLDAAFDELKTHSGQMAAIAAAWGQYTTASARADIEALAIPFLRSKGYKIEPKLIKAATEKLRDYVGETKEKHDSLTGLIGKLIESNSLDSDQQNKAAKVLQWMETWQPPKRAAIEVDLSID